VKSNNEVSIAFRLFSAAPYTAVVETRRVGEYDIPFTAQRMIDKDG